MKLTKNKNRIIKHIEYLDKNNIIYKNDVTVESYENPY